MAMPPCLTARRSAGATCILDSLGSVTLSWVSGRREYIVLCVTAQPSCDADERCGARGPRPLQRSPWCRKAACACPSTADRARDLSSRGRASLPPEPHLAEPAMNPPPIRTETGPARTGDIAAGAPPDRHLAEAILDSIVEAILVFDMATRQVSEINHGTTRLLGIDRADLVGRPFADRFPVAERARLAAAIDELAAGRRDVT